MRLGKNAPYVSSYKAPLATFRHLLCCSVRHWAEDQMKDFEKSLPEFTTPGDYITEHKFREFVEMVLCHIYFQYFKTRFSLFLFFGRAVG